MIPYGRQEITEQDIAAVVEVLRSDFITQGPVVPRFENSVTDYCGVGYGVAVNSGTSALHVACLALDVGPGDVVWTSPISFVASANCARYCGADVDFVDIDPDTINLSAIRLAEKLEQARNEGERLPKVVIPVHFAGQSCDMAAIGQLAAEYGFHIVEDASHAIGGRYKGEPVGSCRYSDITVFSFHPVKVITTGEGGIAVTDNPELAERMGRLRSHGVTRNPKLMAKEPDGPWYYEQIELGWNYRMTELQAALGVSQLERLGKLVMRRLELADRYDVLLQDLPLQIPGRLVDSDSSWHLYVIRLDAVERHEVVFEGLRKAGIGVNLHYIPVHLQPDYLRLGFGQGDFPIAEDYYQRAITIPLYPCLTDTQQGHVVSALRSAMQE